MQYETTMNAFHGVATSRSCHCHIICHCIYLIQRSQHAAEAPEEHLPAWHHAGMSKAADGKLQQTASSLLHHAAQQLLT